MSGIKVNFSANDAGFTSTVRNINGSMDKMGRNVKEVSNTVGASFGSMVKAGAALAIGFGAVKMAASAITSTFGTFKDALDMGFATHIDTAAEELKAVAIAPIFAMKDPVQALPYVATSAPLASALKTAFGADFTSEGDVFAFVQKLHSESEQHKSNEVTARASITSLSKQIEADKEAHQAALKAVESSVNVKVAEIIKAAGVKTPVAASTIATPEQKTTTRAAFNSLSHQERNQFIRDGGKLTD